MKRLTALALATSLLFAGCVPGAPTPSDPNPSASGGQAPAAPRPQTVTVQSIPSPDYSVQVFLWGNAPTNQETIDYVKAAGFTWVKQMFQWNFIEGRGKGRFEWNEPDRIVDLLTRNNLKIIARLDVAPMWARGPGADERLHGPPANMQDYGDFVGAVAERYKGRIQAYQIWNEANLAREWNGRPPNAREYTEMLRVAYQAIKRADPNAIVISGGLSPTTAGLPLAVPDMDFLRQMYQAGAQQYFDILGLNAPGYKAPPDADPAVVARDPRLTNNDRSPEAARRIYAFRHVENMRQIMIENNDANRRVAILEFGWTSDARPNSPYHWHAVSESEKARYIVGAFA
ncbi:MAG: cellulase family glycosylhydrolase, partial [Dehalococcoidia bacterium]|nr:cellulase family glycosylhydrolase [Dehalococcoidia bacterium]